MNTPAHGRLRDGWSMEKTNTTNAHLICRKRQEYMDCDCIIKVIR